MIMFAIGGISVVGTWLIMLLIGAAGVCGWIVISKLMEGDR